MKKKAERLFLFNTLTRKKEPFLPLFPPEVRIYSCGPTVYGHTHLGHMRTYTNTDILLRSLKYFGFKPFQVMNITDVGHLTGDRDTGEDKLEKAARSKGKDAWQLAKQYTQEFFEVLGKLNITLPDISPRATENITEMVLLVGRLEQEGFAYRTSDGIYFDTSKFASYGQLANVSLAKLEEGARVEKNPEKKNPTDFALWKFSVKKDKRQMEWPSPWSKRGFPGWHIECSTMAMKYLSDCFKGGKFYPNRFKTIDIHTGGIDHINVHHTNEIAQSEAATGKKFVNYWLHSNYLQVEGRKMSKSLGNFYTREDLFRRSYQDFMPLRYLFLNTHYRKRLNFTWQALDNARSAYWEMVEILEEIEKKLGDKLKDKTGKGNDKDNFAGKANQFLARFERAIGDDLNTPRGLAVAHQVLREKSLTDKDKWRLVLKFDQVLGLNIKEQGGKLRQKGRKIPQEIAILTNKREEARQKKDWKKADQIRVRIKEKGYLLEDTPEGPKLISKQ
jgi:cysteinyl-tRNA synthetase